MPKPSVALCRPKPMTSIVANATSPRAADCPIARPSAKLCAPIPTAIGNANRRCGVHAATFHLDVARSATAIAPGPNRRATAASACLTIHISYATSPPSSNCQLNTEQTAITQCCTESFVSVVHPIPSLVDRFPTGREHVPCEEQQNADRDRVQRGTQRRCRMAQPTRRHAKHDRYAGDETEQQNFGEGHRRPPFTEWVAVSLAVRSTYRNDETTYSATYRAYRAVRALRALRFLWSGNLVQSRLGRWPWVSRFARRLRTSNHVHSPGSVRRQVDVARPATSLFGRGRSPRLNGVDGDSSCRCGHEAYRTRSTSHLRSAMARGTPWETFSARPTSFQRSPTTPQITHVIYACAGPQLMLQAGEHPRQASAQLPSPPVSSRRAGQ
jgi:hypothetical protein